MCTQATDVIKLMDAAKVATGLSGGAGTTALLGTAGSSSVVACHVSADSSAYAVAVPMKSDNTDSWCVDSTGKSKLLDGAYLGAAAVACP